MAIIFAMHYNTAPIDRRKQKGKNNMNYIAKEVCRIEKIKSTGSLGAVYEHNLRLKDVVNADETRTSYNIELTDRPPGKTFVDIFHEKIANSPWYQDGKHKVAKNAIYAAEFMLTFGSEATDQINIDAWAKDNYRWLCENFGGKDNVISAVLHVDEHTPHIHAIVIPMDEKEKLNYRKYLGGSKYRLSEIQDSYHEQVGELHQLQRGIKGSKATHTDIDNFYSLVNETVAPITLPEPEQKTGFFKKGETAIEYQERITPIVQHAHSVSVAKEKENERLKQKIADIEHLQEGVVPADLYAETLQTNQMLEQKLECALQNEKKSYNLLQETRQSYEKLERSLPKKIADAVAEATAVLQEEYNTMKARYFEIKRKYMPLMRQHNDLQKEHDSLKKQYQELLKSSSRVNDLLWENKLMYTLLTTLNQAYRIDKCRISHAKGDVSIEERLILGKDASQKENAQRAASVQNKPKKSHSYEL
jgi:hypothetical protein